MQKRELSNRRVGYDFTLSVPKSVSLYLAANEHNSVEQVIAEALDETMAMIEARMETNVRKGCQHDNRVSPNMVYAKFVHGKSRLVDGIRGPHYRIHVFAMNATFDEVEKEWEALEVVSVAEALAWVKSDPLFVGPDLYGKLLATRQV